MLEYLIQRLGTRYHISCTEKGDSLDGSGLLTLCTTCWAWRELPENYYPRYVNELVCHNSDIECLSGNLKVEQDPHALRICNVCIWDPTVECSTERFRNTCSHNDCSLHTLQVPNKGISSIYLIHFSTTFLRSEACWNRWCLEDHQESHQ